MLDYRLYSLNRDGRASARAELIDAASDEQAIAVARAKKRPTGSELWCANRLVAQIPPYEQL